MVRVGCLEWESEFSELYRGVMLPISSNILLDATHLISLSRIEASGAHPEKAHRYTAFIQHLSRNHAHGISHVYTVLVPVLQDTLVIVSPYPFTFMSRPPRPSSLWLAASTCWGESRSPACFRSGTRHLLFPSTSHGTVSTNGPNFHMEAQIPSRVDLRSRQEGCV